MRFWIAIGALLAATRAIADDPESPYIAYAAQDEVYVRSGPGGNYYPVLTLKRGDPVKVIRHDPGDWCAIIPPPGSFNWIAADFVEPGQNDVGIVRGDSVAVRTGSDFSDQRDAISTRLYDGDEVLLLDPRKHALGPRDQKWYKIAPLGEELRWIAAKFLVETREEAEPKIVAYDPTPEPQPLTRAEPRKAESKIRDDAVQLAAHEVEAKRTKGWRKPSRRPLRDARTADARNRAVDLKSPALIERASRNENVETATLDELNVALAAIVAEDVSQWNLAPLRARAEALKSQASSSAERKQLRLLVRQIDRFDAIRERRLASGGGDATESSREPAASAADATAGADSASGDAPEELVGGEETTAEEGVTRVDLERRYDGTGRLSEVLDRRKELPPFALLDGKGAVRVYLTPAPGVNLRKLIGRRVGVEGRHGYLPDVKAQHIAVRRVESLD